MIVPCLSLCFSYGSPTGNPITNPNINPRLPIGTTDQVEGKLNLASCTL